MVYYQSLASTVQGGIINKIDLEPKRQRIGIALGVNAENVIPNPFPRPYPVPRNHLRLACPLLQRSKRRP